jgi:hypothetical protein
MVLSLQRVVPGSQGALVPALTLGALCNYSDDNVLAQYPGVEVTLSPELAQRIGRPQIEVDYVLVTTSGEIYICECKVSGHRLAPQEMIEISTLAAALGGRPVFSTLFDFSQLEFPSRQVAGVLAEIWREAEPIWLTEDDLLCPIDPQYRRLLLDRGLPPDEMESTRRDYVERAISHLLASEGFE